MQPEIEISHHGTSRAVLRPRSKTTFRNLDKGCTTLHQPKCIFGSQASRATNRQRNQNGAFSDGHRLLHYPHAEDPQRMNKYTACGDGSCHLWNFTHG